MKLRDFLFKDLEPCSNHDCIVKKPAGMGTNGSCKCLLDFSRSELHLLNSRIKSVLDKKIGDL